jgi:hypothetical protein
LPVSFFVPSSTSNIGSVSHPAGDRPSHPNLVNELTSQMGTSLYVSDFATSRRTYSEEMAKSARLCSNNRAVRFLKLVFATLVLGTTLASADLAPTLSTKGLANSADLIVVGKWSAYRKRGQVKLCTTG